MQWSAKLVPRLEMKVPCDSIGHYLLSNQMEIRPVCRGDSCTSHSCNTAHNRVNEVVVSGRNENENMEYSHKETLCNLKMENKNPLAEREWRNPEGIMCGPGRNIACGGAESATLTHTSGE